jgi:hypothetical protein
LIRLKESLGVSICPDLVSIETLDLNIVKQFVSTVKKISIFSKSLSLFRLDINVQTQKYRLRSRNRSRPGNFVIYWQFISISIKKLVDFCIFLVEISQFVKTFCHFHTQNVSKMSRFLDKSRFVSTNLDNLDDLDKNLDKTKSQLKSLDFKNLHREKKSLS